MRNDDSSKAGLAGFCGEPARTFLVEVKKEAPRDLILLSKPSARAEYLHLSRLPFFNGEDFDDVIRGAKIVECTIPISPDFHFQWRFTDVVIIYFYAPAGFARFNLYGILDGPIRTVFFLTRGHRIASCSGDNSQQKKAFEP